MVEEREEAEGKVDRRCFLSRLSMPYVRAGLREEIKGIFSAK